MYILDNQIRKKIFVLKNNYEKAKGLTSYIISNFNKNADNEDNEDDDNNKYNLIKKLFKIYILGGILIVIVIFIIALITQT